jgi:molybdopterin-containing oxidoreductase family membrane subunit
MMQLDRDHLHELFSGEESLLFWSVQIFGMFIPIILLLFKKMRTPLPMMIISVFVVIGAWLKRMIIVIPTQFHPTFPIQNVPENFHHYDPTLIEITITSATVAMVLLVITLFVRLFPILPIWEIAHESGHHDIEKEIQK